MKRWVKVAILLGFVIGISAFAGVDSSSSGYQGLNEANTLMSNTEGTMSKAIAFASFIFGWILIIGFPIGGYYLGYKHFKEKDEQDRSGNPNTAMIHAKGAIIAIIAAIAGALLFEFVYVKTLNVDTSFGSALKKVLKIDQAFGGNNGNSGNNGGSVNVGSGNNGG